MDKNRIYEIKIGGLVDEALLNVMSPVEMRLEEVEPSISHLTIEADQSGLIGLLRHLHSLGFLLLSLERQQVGVDAPAPCA